MGKGSPTLRGAAGDEGLTDGVRAGGLGRMAGPAGFVGREGELSRLLGALGGDARLALVVGDAGVGKTRFVAEGMARAAAGIVMVRGECLPLAGTLPLLPVAEALGELARLDGGGLLAAALDAAPGYVRGEVERLLPGTRRWPRRWPGTGRLRAARPRSSRPGSPPDRDHWLAHVNRAEIDLLRGDTDAAAERWQLIYASPAHRSRVDFAYESAPRAVEAPLWAGRPCEALRKTRRALALFQAPDLTIFSGRLLAAGMRACADLAGQARARRDQPADADAEDAADGLAAWVEQMAGAPFTDHPFVATIAAWRATWDAERTRVTGPGDPGAWDGAAKAWQDLSCPHWAGYAWWRQAQAQLDAGQAAAATTGPLRAAASAADGHAPLLAQVRTLAERARIPLQPSAAEPGTPPPARRPLATGSPTGS